MKTLTRHKENKLKAEAEDGKEQATNSYSLVIIQGGQLIMRQDFPWFNQVYANGIICNS